MPNSKNVKRGGGIFFVERVEGVGGWMRRGGFSEEGTGFPATGMSLQGFPYRDNYPC
jgi:hypothetical protein